MTDRMLQPYCVMISTRSGYEPLLDNREVNGKRLPVKFKDWWEANDYAAKNPSELIRLEHYYPRYADLERAYIESLVAKERDLLADHHVTFMERVSALRAEFEAIP